MESGSSQTDRIGELFVNDMQDMVGIVLGSAFVFERKVVGMGEWSWILFFFLSISEKIQAHRGFSWFGLWIRVVVDVV